MKTMRISFTVSDPGLIERLEAMGRFEKSALAKRGILAVLRLEAQGYTVDDQGRVGRLLDQLEAGGAMPATIRQPDLGGTQTVQPDPAMKAMLDSF
ncbi:MAG: hypothetical protein M1272_01040 [Firmicutes bacterium]|nr:hypothetical protein [Bacillota bacterium]